MQRIRTALLELAHNEPSIRPPVLKVVRQAGKWQSLPKGWDEGSVQKFWESLTGDNKHKVTKCIKEMEGKVDDPGAFCASLADKVLGPEWRSKKADAARPMAVRSLPAAVQQALAEVRFAKGKVSVRTDTSYSMYSAGDDGAKGFTALVDLNTNQVQVVWGAFGGGGLGQKPSPVDDVNTPRKPLPEHLVVVQGQIGGRDPYASITVNPAGMSRLLPAKRADTMEFGPEDVDRLVPAFIKAVEDNVVAYHKRQYPNLDPPKIYAEKGQRYYRIVRETSPGQRSAFGFIDRQTGALLKSESWKKPARHPRGFIQDKASWAGSHSPWGMAYLRAASAVAQKYLRRSVTKVALDPGFVNPKTKELAKRAWGYLKGLKPSYSQEVDLPSNVGGFIKWLFFALDDRQSYTKLHSFFGDMSGVGSGFGLDDELKRLAHRMAEQMNKAEAVVVGILLLRAARRPKAAMAFERWVDTHLDLSSESVQTEPLQSAGEVFEELVKEWEAAAALAVGRVGKENVQTLAFLIAEDINWHALNRTGLLGGGDGEGLPENIQQIVSGLSMELDYSLEPAAAFFVAMLRKAGEKGTAEAIKRYTLKEFPESFEGGPVRSAAIRRTASARRKVAADLRPLLYELFDSVQPYVRDFRRFVNTLASDIIENGEFMGWQWAMEGKPEVKSMGGGTAWGRQTGGGWHSPPEYEEAEYGIPEEIGVTVKAILPLRYWPRIFAKSYRSLLKDPDGFMRAIHDLLGNDRALAMLKKLALDALKFAGRTDPSVLLGYVHDEVQDFVYDVVKEDSSSRYVEVSWSFDEAKTKLNRVYGKVTGTGIEIFADLSVFVGEHSGEIDYSAIEEDRAEARMDDYEDRYYDRYAAENPEV